MCIDNPREGFGELFDTHPSVESRVAALVKFAGGHDPGPIAVSPQPDDAATGAGNEPATQGPWNSAPAPESRPQGEPVGGSDDGPWGSRSSEAAAPAAVDPPAESPPGPWGPHSGN